VTYGFLYGSIRVHTLSLTKSHMLAVSPGGCLTHWELETEPYSQKNIRISEKYVGDNNRTLPGVRFFQEVLLSPSSQWGTLSLGMLRFVPYRTSAGTTKRGDFSDFFPLSQRILRFLPLYLYISFRSDSILLHTQETYRAPFPNFFWESSTTMIVMRSWGCKSRFLPDLTLLSNYYIQRPISGLLGPKGLT
jgi:hypothetical protein